MFCPKCGSLLTWRADASLKRDVFYCPPGDMWMSVNLTERLLERYGVQEPADSVWWQGRRQYYCPGCGVRLQEGLICSRCGKSLRDLHRTLVELHPHEGGPTP